MFHFLRKNIAKSFIKHDAVFEHRNRVMKAFDSLLLINKSVQFSDYANRATKL